jgi:mitogen-activated protein kinase kinase 7
MIIKNDIFTNNIPFQKMCQSHNAEEQKRIVMDLDVVLKSHDCPYIVACLGAFISEVWWFFATFAAVCGEKLVKMIFFF